MNLNNGYFEKKNKFSWAIMKLKLGKMRLLALSITFTDFEKQQ